MKGKGSIPEGLWEAIGILAGQVPSDYRHPSETADFERKRATMQRLIHKSMAKGIPFAPSETQTRFLAAVREVQRERPELFRQQIEPATKEALRSDGRLFQQARLLLDGWMRDWIRCGQSPGLLMSVRPDIEKAIRKWWERRKRFQWATLPQERTEMIMDVRITAETIACRAFWNVINHPNRSRFRVCDSCGQVFYARRESEDRRYCSACRKSNVNSLKPYKIEPEEEKLEIARGLLERASGPNWKRTLLNQQETKQAGITGHWLTRRIREGKLALPGGLKGEK